MATPALPPGASGQNLDGQPPQPMLQPPGIDMTGICFRDQLWLNTYPLDRNLIFDYFALSPFYDWQCINEDLRRRGIHPLDISHLSKMTGLEYMLTEAAEPNLFVIRKRWRDGPEKVTDLLAYYVLDGSIYQSPQLTSIFAARVGRALYHVSKAFTTAASKLEKIGYAEPENESEIEAKAVKETIDFKEVKRVDHILASLQRKLPPAPPPPPFPDGFIPLPTSEAEKETENQQGGENQAPHVDPIIDQGPAKRMKF